MAWDDIRREKDSVSGDRPFDIIGGLLSKIADTAEKTKGELMRRAGCPLHKTSSIRLQDLM